MEIFLLLLLIAIVLYSHSSTKTRLTNLQSQIWDFENRLSSRNTNADATSKSQVAKEKVKEVHKENRFTDVLPVITEVIPAPVEEPVAENVPEPRPFTVITKHEVNTDQNQPVVDSKPVDVSTPDDLTGSPNEPEMLEGWYASFVKKNPDLERFVGENLISKIGILIVVLGISYFVKYAIDQNWINETARAGIGILAGGILMAIAHRVRENFKAFSSVLVAGAVSVFYFTISIAFQQYHLFSQPVAFAIMVVITALSSAVSIGYNRQELAVLSILGGFAAPFMVSTGEGNYKVFFTYLLILDTGMLLLAYLRGWNLVSLISYLLSMLFFGIWFGKEVYEKGPDAPYSGSMLFSTLFYLLFTLAFMVNQFKEKRKFNALELSLILSNTFLYFSFGMLDLKCFKPDLQGVFTLSLAMVNVFISWNIHRKSQVDKNLFYLMIGITLTFITLIAPVQLQGNYITLFWAAESAMLLWLSQRSGMVVYRFVSIPVAALALLSLFIDWKQLYEAAPSTHLMPVFNKAFLTSMFVVISLLVNRYLIKQDKDKELDFLGLNYNANALFWAFTISALAFSYLATLLELKYQGNYYFNDLDKVNGLLLSWHIVFTGIIVLITRKIGKLMSEVIALVAIGLNILFYFLLSGSMVISELSNRFLPDQQPEVLYFLHLACLILIIPLVRTGYRILTEINGKVAAYLLTAFLTISLCIESSVNGVFLFFHPDLSTSANYMPAMMELDHLRATIVKSVYPILWGLLAFILLSAGIKNRNRHLRIAALALTALTIGKLFIYDVRNVSQAGKIVSFILLGIVLIVISFTYQKLKFIILDDKEDSSDDPTA